MVINKVRDWVYGVMYHVSLKLAARYIDPAIGAINDMIECHPLCWGQVRDLVYESLWLVDYAGGWGNAIHAIQIEEELRRVGYVK